MGEENLDKLKETVKKRIAQDYETASKMKQKRSLLDALDKAYKFDVPAKLVDMEYEAIVKQYENAKKTISLTKTKRRKGRRPAERIQGNRRSTC